MNVSYVKLEVMEETAVATATTNMDGRTSFGCHKITVQKCKVLFSLKRDEWFSLSTGERAGVRENVFQPKVHTLFSEIVCGGAIV